MADYDRYSLFRINGQVLKVPFIEIPKKSTDYHTRYHMGKTRLDILSNDYYGSPDYGWLILEANPEYGALEFEIPDESDLRIPFPLDTTIEQYNQAVKEYKEQYGLD